MKSAEKKTQVILATVLVAEKFLIDALSGLLPKPMKLSKSVLPGFAAMILELPSKAIVYNAYGRL